MQGRIAEIRKKYDIWWLVAGGFLLRLFAFISPNAITNPEFFRDYYTVSSLIHGRMLVLLGPPAIVGGLHFGPFYYYWMAFFTILTNGSAYGLVLCAAVTSALSVYALFRLVLLWTGRRDIAMIVALLCTCSMYAISLASYVSNPNFLPLFVVWFFYCLTKALRGEGGLWNAVWLGLSFGCATQLHVTALVVLSAVSALSYLIIRPTVTIKKALVFVSVLVISYAPYLWYEINHAFLDATRLISLGGGELRGIAGLSNVHTIASFFSAALLPIVNNDYAFTSLRPGWLELVVGLIAMLFIGYIFYQVSRNRGNKAMQSEEHAPAIAISREGVIILVSWLVVSCIMLMAYRHYARYYYAIILWPIPIILITYASWWTGNHLKTKHALAGLFVAFGIIQIISFEAVPHSWNWSGFYSEYKAVYEYDPNILNIGSPGYEDQSK
jgi:4-amino-4-deoxy-L-arabinose transferase-like glycosyltransferase